MQTIGDSSTTKEVVRFLFREAKLQDGKKKQTNINKNKQT